MIFYSSTISQQKCWMWNVHWIPEKEIIILLKLHMWYIITRIRRDRKAERSVTEQRAFLGKEVFRAKCCSRDSGTKFKPFKHPCICCFALVNIFSVNLNSGGAFWYACNYTGPERARSSESKSPAKTWMHLPHSSCWSAQQGHTLTSQKTQARSVWWWSPPQTSTWHIQLGRGGFCSFPDVALEQKPRASPFLRGILGGQQNTACLNSSTSCTGKANPVWVSSTRRKLGSLARPSSLDASTLHLGELSSHFPLSFFHFLTASGENPWSTFLCSWLTIFRLSSDVVHREHLTQS